VRIAFDCQTFVLQAYGGISRYFTQLTRGLLGLEQQVAIFAPLHRNRHLLTLPSEVTCGRYRTDYPRKTTRLFLAYNKLASRSRIARWKPDVMHETYYARTGSAPRTCPTVVTVHDMTHELFPTEFPATDRTAAVKRIAIDRADHVICVSENTKSDLMRLYGTSASKLSVVYHGFDQWELPTNARRPMAPGSKPFLLYVGERRGYKNFAGLLRAVALSKRLLSDFDIVAFGGPKFSSVELRLIISLGMTGDRVLHKTGDDELLGSLYSAARALVYPSLYEGFGLPPLEAMAHRCPVVSSNSSAMPEIIGCAAEYFKPGDTDDMRRAIEAVVYFDSRAESLRNSGAERLSTFSWKKCVQETSQVYESLI